MVQALKAGELDYARGPNAEQLKALETEPNIKTVVGTANGWTQLAFNELRRRHGQDDPRRRAIDQGALGSGLPRRARLRDRQADPRRPVLGGYGDVGTTIVPPVLGQWHVEPTSPRPSTSSSRSRSSTRPATSSTRTATAWTRRASRSACGSYYPNTDATYPKAAQFIKDWYGQLGIKVTAQQSRLGDPGRTSSCRPRPASDYKAELRHRAVGLERRTRTRTRCSRSSGATRSAPRRTASTATRRSTSCTTQQNAAATADARKTILAQMQNMIYDQAVYDILYYDANLAAYRTDQFGGWQNQPLANGTPLFTYGTLDYTLLTDATAVPTPAPSEAVASVGPGRVRAPRPPAAAQPAPRRARRRRTPASTSDPRRRSSRCAVAHRRGGRHRAGVVQPSAQRRRGPPDEDESTAGPPALGRAAGPRSLERRSTGSRSVRR